MVNSIKTSCCSRENCLYGLLGLVLFELYIMKLICLTCIAGLCHTKNTLKSNFPTRICSVAIWYTLPWHRYNSVFLHYFEIQQFKAMPTIRVSPYLEFWRCRLLFHPCLPSFGLCISERSGFFELRVPSNPNPVITSFVLYDT